MIILSIDTSGREGSVALARGDAGSFKLIESAAIRGGTFSAELVPQIAELLARNSLRKEQLDGFAVISGPGSFTGLRVGLSAIKALAEILQKPIAATSLLEALAVSLEHSGRVIALLDAQRNEIYAGEYEVTKNSARRIEESVIAKDILPRVAEDKNWRSAKIVAGDPVVAALLPNFSVRIVARPSATDGARIGLEKLLRGETVGVDQLDANYVRRSDAEIYSLPKLTGAK